MSQKISLRQAEQKVFKSAFEDGLWDVFIGCISLQFAIGPFFSRSLGDFWSAAVFLPFWALAFVAIWLVRKHVVRPRVGIVKFGSWRKSRLIKFNLAMLVACSFALILGILSAMSFGEAPGWIRVARFSLVVLVGFSVSAYFLNFSRLYLYGVMIALSPLVGEWLYVHIEVPHHGFPVTFGITSAIIILTGLVKFTRLLRHYPIPIEESPSAGTCDG